jgi:hypothetical protein
MTNVLILGHGRSYSKSYVACSPIDIDDWFYKNYICVDYDESCMPDIVFDLRKKNWDSLNNLGPFDIVIDTCGKTFCHSDINGNLRYNGNFINNIYKLLPVGGIFYGNQGSEIKL